MQGGKVVACHGGMFRIQRGGPALRGAYMKKMDYFDDGARFADRAPPSLSERESILIDLSAVKHESQAEKAEELGITMLRKITDLQASMEYYNETEGYNLLQRTGNGGIPPLVHGHKLVVKLQPPADWSMYPAKKKHVEGHGRGGPWIVRDQNRRIFCLAMRELEGMDTAVMTLDREGTFRKQKHAEGFVGYFDAVYEVQDGKDKLRVFIDHCLKPQDW